MKHSWMIVSVLGLGLLPSLAQAADQAAVSEAALNKVTTVCQNCHGARGDSVSGTFPRLNGQQAAYIEAQLKNFRSHGRSDPHAVAYMWGMASQLDDPMIAELAKYYAGQKATAPQTGGALAAKGKDIFDNGVPANGIPPCAACHGANGQGDKDTPRIAGQHAAYLTSQLEAFRALLRENQIMHANTKDMTDSQIEAIVSYLGND
jgi:cytochrome c553